MKCLLFILLHLYPCSLAVSVALFMGFSAINFLFKSICATSLTMWIWPLLLSVRSGIYIAAYNFDPMGILKTDKGEQYYIVENDIHRVNRKSQYMEGSIYIVS